MNSYQKTNLVFAVIGMTCLGWIAINATIATLTLIGLVVLYVLLMFWLSMNMWTNFFVEAISQMPKGKVMLTFDDGPHPVHTPEVLKILKEKGVKAMFFLVGKNADQYPDLVKRIYEEGHLIGGHSYAHDFSFGLQSKKNMNSDIMKAQQCLSDLVGRSVKWFRPPFGVTNPQVARCVTDNDLNVVGWNIRSFDTAESNPDRLAQKVSKKLRSGGIILLHDRLPQTVKALPKIIEAIRNKKLALDVLSIYEKDTNEHH